MSYIKIKAHNNTKLVAYVEMECTFNGTTRLYEGIKIFDNHDSYNVVFPRNLETELRIKATEGIITKLLHLQEDYTLCVESYGNAGLDAPTWAEFCKDDGDLPDDPDGGMHEYVEDEEMGEIECSDEEWELELDKAQKVRDYEADKVDYFKSDTWKQHVNGTSPYMKRIISNYKAENLAWDEQ